MEPEGSCDHGGKVHTIIRKTSGVGLLLCSEAVHRARFQAGWEIQPATLKFISQIRSR